MSETLETNEAPESETPVQFSPVPSEDQGFRAPGGGTRDDVRARIKARRPFTAESVTLDDGSEIEVRSMTLGERAAMFDQLTDDEGNFDRKRMQAAYVLHCSFVGGEKLFADDELDYIQGLDSGYIAPVVDAAQKISGNAKKAEEVREDEAKK